jgi:TraY domain
MPAKKPSKRKPGRPPLPGGERVPLGLRVTKDVRKGLNEACKASGRSLSQEAEFRLEQTFKAQNAVFDALDLAYGRPWSGLMLAIAEVAQITGTRALSLSQWNFHGCEDWGSDPYAYDQAASAIKFVLEAFRPQGAIVAPPNRLRLPADAYARLGEGFAREMLNGLLEKKAGPPWPFAHIAKAIRERLTELLPTVRMPPDAPLVSEKAGSRGDR